MGIELYPHQIDAIKRMHNRCILCGGVGSGKSRAALTYFVYSCGGKLCINGKGKYKEMTDRRTLYIITTAKKRDTGEWIQESIPFYIAPDIVVDSWNNIKKYVNVYGAFFIFDEQRLIGSGAWVKAFYKIARKNKWILLSATPGDAWIDYVPVFVANGFYKNKTEFLAMHAVFKPYSRYRQIDRYVDIDILEELRDKILVTMPYERNTVRHNIDILCEYDKQKYKTVWRDRWDPYDDEPIRETGALFYLMRRVVNEDDSRISAVIDILKEHKRAIVFYNFNYELEALRKMCSDLDIIWGEWNGLYHQDVPDTDMSKSWVYLVQYTAGAEGWNCTTCDTVIFFSQNYSYKLLEQASGRIDRLNTKYVDLYYYHLKSRAPIDLAINQAIKKKKKFNEASYLRKRTTS